MKVMIDNEVREMTQEEAEQYYAQTGEEQEYQPTQEERIAELEAELEAAKIILGVE